MMDLIAFASAVRDMRKLQKDYFYAASRGLRERPQLLLLCKEKELEVDGMIRELLKSQQPGQKQLF